MKPCLKKSLVNTRHFLKCGWKIVTHPLRSCCWASKADLHAPRTSLDMSSAFQKIIVCPMKIICYIVFQRNSYEALLKMPTFQKRWPNFILTLPIPRSTRLPQHDQTHVAPLFSFPQATCKARGTGFPRNWAKRFLTQNDPSAITTPQRFFFSIQCLIRSRHANWPRITEDPATCSVVRDASLVYYFE